MFRSNSFENGERLQGDAHVGLMSRDCAGVWFKRVDAGCHAPSQY